MDYRHKTILELAQERARERRIGWFLAMVCVAIIGVVTTDLATDRTRGGAPLAAVIAPQFPKARPMPRAPQDDEKAVPANGTFYSKSKPPAEYIELEDAHLWTVIVDGDKETYIPPPGGRDFRVWCSDDENAQPSPGPWTYCAEYGLIEETPTAINGFLQ